jgi:flavorubredoxin
MKARKIMEGIEWVGAIDWNRRLFDSLIPLPDGTSYNAYLLRGGVKNALLDTVDVPMAEALLRQLENVATLDYIVAHHAEQDHAGAIPRVLAAYPNAKIVCTPKGKEMLIDHLDISPGVFITVKDGEKIDLGGMTMQFVHTPWVHWPETMSTFVPERKILFSCDFFGSHLAASNLYVTDEAVVKEAAKRYYAEIMMPFRQVIRKNMAKVADLAPEMIAPSHGPVYDKPKFIIDAYNDWISDETKNEVVLPYVSMHGSTKLMVEYLIEALAERGVTVRLFDMAVTDLGKLAIALVDAATLVIGTPTVNSGPHPVVIHAAHLVNALRPKLKYVSVVGSYGWNTRAAEQIMELITNVKVETLPPIMCRGIPHEKDFAALDQLAATIAEKHRKPAASEGTSLA